MILFDCRLRSSVRKELAAIEEANRQIKESIGEQDKVFEYQKEQIEKAKASIGRMHEEKQQMIHRLEMSYHASKVNKLGDEQFFNDYSLNHRAGSIDRTSQDRHPFSTRKGSAKSNSQSQAHVRQSDSNKFITIHFDKKQAEPKSNGDLNKVAGGSVDDKKQMIKQVNSYEMNDEAKKFLEEYLKEDIDTTDQPVIKASDRKPQSESMQSIKPAETSKAHGQHKPADSGTHKGPPVQPSRLQPSLPGV